MDSLQLAELLCARICHDLSGPVGAAAAGAELFEDMDGVPDPETLGLVAGAAAGAAQRLKFFRAALGPAASAPQSTVALRELIEAYLGTQVSAASPGIALSWPAAPTALPGAGARLLLNLVLLAKDALPRGGRIRIDAADGRPQVIAHGEPASLSDEARQVLVEGLPPSGPRGAQAELARILADRDGGKLKVSITPDGLALSVGASGV
ncbi:MAG TPA: histidine phosphotransferase family protein [Magnetospirillum sp.]|nr:histidine phosphotransferase family protein [Magnetospirillum sp.]